MGLWAPLLEPLLDNRACVGFFFVCAVANKTACIWVQGVAGQLEGARAWGSQGAALGQLNQPCSVVAMSSGGVWVADAGNHRLCLLH